MKVRAIWRIGLILSLSLSLSGCFVTDWFRWLLSLAEPHFDSYEKICFVAGPFVVHDPNLDFVPSESDSEAFFAGFERAYQRAGGLTAGVSDVIHIDYLIPKARPVASCGPGSSVSSVSSRASYRQCLMDWAVASEVYAKQRSKTFCQGLPPMISGAELDLTRGGGVRGTPVVVDLLKKKMHISEDGIEYFENLPLSDPKRSHQRDRAFYRLGLRMGERAMKAAEDLIGARREEE